VRQPLRRRRERRTPAASDLTITSMVDMFTMILTFLLNFVDPSMGEESPLSLPTARATSAAADGVTVQVTREDIRVGGTFVAQLAPGSASTATGVEREGVVIVALEEALRKGGVKEEVPLVLECDRRVPFSLVGDVLQTARRAGFTHYRFVVDREAK
jgi:biopolymer transport protein ExbD